MIRAIITGATGMVGEGVLHECLLDNRVESILVVGRRSCNYSHPKLRELIIKDFFNLSEIKADLTGFNACFFCLGTSSVGLTEIDYTRITYDLTLGFAKTLAEINHDITFCYVSGAGIDSSEKGRIMWAQVKGRTENDLMKLPFSKVYAFRPGFIRATKGLKNTLKYYKYFSWFYPVGRLFFPGYVCTLQQIGIAMINAVAADKKREILSVKQIIKLSEANDF